MDEPVFREPWEAQAFALAVALHERGAFTWGEWSATLSEELEGAESYYHGWLAALERMVAAHGLADAETLARHRAAWARADARTPHGTPIELTPGDF